MEILCGIGSLGSSEMIDTFLGFLRPLVRELYEWRIDKKADYGTLRLDYGRTEGAVSLGFSACCLAFCELPLTYFFDFWKIFANFSNFLSRSCFVQVQVFDVS